jgi:hypothetical protein
VLYRLECERPHHRSSKPSISRRHWYALALTSNPDLRSTLSFRNRDRGSLHPDAHRDECCLQQGARENHKLFLLLHSRVECCLHRCVVLLHLLMENKFDIPSACSCLSGLIAFRIWRTQKQTNDAKMGSNLMQVSVIVIESGAFHLFPLATTTAISHACDRKQVRSI